MIKTVIAMLAILGVAGVVLDTPHRGELYLEPFGVKEVSKPKPKEVSKPKPATNLEVSAQEKLEKALDDGVLTLDQIIELVKRHNNRDKK